VHVLVFAIKLLTRFVVLMHIMCICVNTHYIILLRILHITYYVSGDILFFSVKEQEIDFKILTI